MNGARHGNHEGQWKAKKLPKAVISLACIYTHICIRTSKSSFFQMVSSGYVPHFL